MNDLAETAEEVIVMTRQDMIQTLEEIRPDIPVSFWNRFDDKALDAQVQVAQEWMQQHADDLLSLA